MRIEKQIEREKTAIGLLAVVLMVALLAMTGCAGPPVERYDQATVDNLNEAEYIHQKDMRPDLHPRVKAARADWFKAAREYELAKPGAPEGASPEYQEPGGDTPETPEEEATDASESDKPKGDLLRSLQRDIGPDILSLQDVRRDAHSPDRTAYRDAETAERPDSDNRYRAEVCAENRARLPGAGPCFRGRDATGDAHAAGGRARPGQDDAGDAARGGGGEPRASGAVRDRRRDGGRDQDSGRADRRGRAWALDCGDGIPARSDRSVQNGQAGFTGRGLDPVHRPRFKSRGDRWRKADQRELHGAALARPPERAGGSGARARGQGREHRRA